MPTMLTDSKNVQGTDELFYTDEYLDDPMGFLNMLGEAVAILGPATGQKEAPKHKVKTLVVFKRGTSRTKRSVVK